MYNKLPANNMGVIPRGARCLMGYVHDPFAGYPARDCWIAKGCETPRRSNDTMWWRK